MPLGTKMNSLEEGLNSSGVVLKEVAVASKRNNKRLLEMLVAFVFLGLLLYIILLYFTILAAEGSRDLQC